MSYTDEILTPKEGLRTYEEAQIKGCGVFAHLLLNLLESLWQVNEV